MFNNLTIRGKMTMLAIASLLLLMLLGGAAYLLQKTLTGEIDTSIVTGQQSTTAVANARAAHVDFQRQVQEWKNVLIRGNDAELYAKHRKAFEDRAQKVQTGLAETEKDMATIGMSTAPVAQLRKDHQEMLSKYLTALKSFDPADAETGKKVDVLVRGVDRATSDNFDKLIESLVAHTVASLAEREAESKKIAQTSLLGTLIGLLVALLLFAMAFVIIRRVNRDIQNLNGVVEKLNSGEFAARCAVTPNKKDELNRLGGALNQLLDERISSLQAASDENDQMNTSVIGIMTAVAQLAQRDLNVKVPVSEDITGAVSDAINMMTTSTARALREVTTISTQVSDSSGRVKLRADAVYKLADEASNQANAASAELSSTANSLQQIGEQAQGAGRDAERALSKTAEALAVVRETVSGITTSRDQIRETEKRVKRLAERSQEISSAVSIIGKISERTSVLALNASMQAVAAGEAGRGFAAVADEVKRLAENAREATQQIAGLVSAIQSDTTETLQAMNSTIAQVVDITRLADSAGTQMNETREATEALATSVRQISQATQTQADTSQRLLARAYDLISASQRTLEEIEQQRGDTADLSESASALVRTVSEFRLPA
jgi:methyl-accepting chemotaxis protein